MNFLKFFLITISITSFLSTSVLSKSFSLCAESHSENINIKNLKSKHSCHSSPKRKAVKIFALNVTVI